MAGLIEMSWVRLETSVITPSCEVEMNAQLLSKSASVESGRTSQNGVRVTYHRCIDHLPIQYEDAFT